MTYPRNSATGAPRRRVRAALAAGILMTLTACSTTSSDISDILGTSPEKQFVQVPQSQLWFQVPQAQVAMQRSFRGGMEQRVGFANATGTAGDNFLLMQAQERSSRLQFEVLERRIGGFPAPFKGADPGTFKAGQDGTGSYFWAEHRSGADTMCVLAIRRLGLASSQLPPRYSSVDVLMRNCVRGTATDALQPIMNLGSVSLPGSIGGSAGNNPQMLSPLAAPTP